MTRATPMAPEQRRQAIVQATVPLLLASGTDVTTREIANAAGVAEGTIFRAFESKTDLLNEAILHCLRVDQAAAQLAAIDSDKPLVQVVTSCLQILGDEISRTRALTSLLSQPTASRNRYCPVVDPGERRLRLRAAITTALSPHADEMAVEPETAASMILAMGFALSHQMAGLTSARELADLVLHGIAGKHR